MNTYGTGETINRTDIVRIGKGKVDYSVTLPSDPFAPASVEIENLATGRHKVIPAARLTLVSAAPAECSHSWTEASETGRKCGACGEPVADDVPADYDPEQTYADAAAYVAEVAPEVFAAGERAATLADLTAARERAADNLADAFGDAPEAEDTGEVVECCPVCGEPSDYCQGHGETGDNRGWTNMIAHDHGDHIQCDPRGCEAAGTTEHADYPHSVGYLDSCYACTSGSCVCCESESFAPCVSDDCEAREMEGDDVADATEDTHRAFERDNPTMSRVVAPENKSRAGARLAMLLAFLVSLAVVFGLAGVGAPPVFASPEVTEDSEAWNCATMGDRECGPRAAVPVVPVHCFPLPGRPGNTRYVMLAPVAGLVAGCEA